MLQVISITNDAKRAEKKQSLPYRLPAEKVIDLGADRFNEQVYVGRFGYAEYRRAEWSPRWRDGKRLPFWVVYGNSLNGGQRWGKDGKHMMHSDHDWTEDEVIHYLGTGELPF